MEEKELRELIKKGENEYIEFKPIGEFNRSKEIAKQLVAFANRDGGKLLFGVNDDKIIEGVRINFDQRANRISNIAKEHCSPQIQFNSYRFPLDEGDVLVIDIEKRKDIPHAIVNRKNSEIEKRAYHIRTISGTRMIDDKELEWLFKDINSKDLNFNFNMGLRLGINSKHKIFRDEDFITSSLFTNGPPGQNDYNLFLEQIKSSIYDICVFKDKDENKELFSLLFELLPFVILYELSKVYRKTWAINITRNHPIIAHENLKEKCKIFDISKIKIPKKIQLNKLVGDFFSEKIYQEQKTIAIPNNTKITLDFKNDGTSTKQILMKFQKENSFLSKIKLIPQRSSFRRYKDFSTLHMDYLPDYIAIFNINLEFYSNLNFPDRKNEDIFLYYDYISKLGEIIRLLWNTDYKPERFIDSKMFLIDRKIDMILNEFKQQEFQQLLDEK